ncbi:minor tail protein [Gordonia phage JuJu]|uniref:Minor tail protein n=1 Tax=Gordonia phage JuJu TaxID=2590929 RepID=A0A516KR15_9CAUD|nr:minor tail protein [Gordonia phage JuJu]QDP44134.1 minor tail protein [Gordonia phage JuJu]
MRNRAVLTDHTIVEWISPKGERVRLSGAKKTAPPELGAWLSTGGIDGIGHLDVKALFDAAARQWGEDYVGETLDHAELDVPLFILGANPDDFRRRVEHLRTLIRRHEVGWLAVYTNSTGWRWVAARLGYLKPTFPFDPSRTSAANYELMLIVEHPIPRAADHADSWKNTTNTGKGSVSIYPGPLWQAWPQFAFQGPGRLRLRYAGNDVDHPFTVLADETILINTDEARPTIRSAKTGRNLWPLMKGRKYTHPVPEGEVTRVDITVTGGNTNTELWVICRQQYEGLL